MQKLADTLQMAIAQMRANPAPLQSNLPKEKLTNPFDLFDTTHPIARKAWTAVKEWVYATCRGESRGLVLWSQEGRDAKGNITGYGCGKTMLAQIAYQYIRQSSRLGRLGINELVPVQYFRTVDFYAMFRDAYAEDRPEWSILKSVCSGSVVLDDFGKEYVKVGSENWAAEKFYRMIDSLNEHYSLLITSNHNPEEIEQFIGGASWSRLRGMCGGFGGFVDMSGLSDWRTR